MSQPAAVFMPIGRHPALQAIDPAHAEVARALYGRRFDVPMSATESLRVCFAEAAPAELALQLGVRCAGHDYDLQVSDPAALSSLAPTLNDSVPEGLRRAVLVHSTQPLWDALAAWFGSPIELLDLKGRSAGWPAGQSLHASFVRADSTTGVMHSGALRVRPRRADGWSALVRAATAVLPASPPAHDPPMDLSLRCSRVALTLREVEALGPGDVVLLDGAPGRQPGTVVRLFLGNRELQGFQALQQGGRLRLTHVADGKRRPSSMFRRHAMDPSLPPQPLLTRTGMPPAERDSACGIDAVLVDVHVETGRLTMPLSSLRNLAVGQVFDTLQSLDSGNLVLWCGGQRLGLGQLVAVGDHVGVRITTLDALMLPAAQPAPPPQPQAAASADAS